MKLGCLRIVASGANSSRRATVEQTRMRLVVQGVQRCLQKESRHPGGEYVNIYESAQIVITYMLDQYRYVASYGGNLASLWELTTILRRFYSQHVDYSATPRNIVKPYIASLPC
jgi:hypothetical protein